MGQSLQEFLSGLPPALSRLGTRDAERPELCTILPESGDPARIYASWRGYASDTMIAQTIRAELAQAVTCGVFAADTEFSTRVVHRSAINVDIVRWPGAVFTPQFTEYIMDPTMPDPTLDGPPRLVANSRLAPELAHAIADATAIANRHNYNRSDISTGYFDYGYSLNVSADPVEAISRTQIAAEANPEFAALRQRAIEAAAVLGPKVVRSLCGRAGLAGAGDWTLKRLLAVAKRADGRPVEYDKRRRGWFPVSGGQP